MRKFGLFSFSLLALCVFTHAQHVDFAVGDTTLMSSQNTTDVAGFLPPPERGGAYPAVSLQYILPNRFGVSAEGSFRVHKGMYNGFQPYRPILYDINGVFAPRFTARMTGNFMAGVGGQTVLFYNQVVSCSASNEGCRININSTHFLLHAAAELQYYAWRNFFVRPEAHWYFVRNNVQFHSDNVFRVGASIGYTFGSR